MSCAAFLTMFPASAPLRHPPLSRKRLNTRLSKRLNTRLSKRLNTRLSMRLCMSLSKRLSGRV